MSKEQNNEQLSFDVVADGDRINPTLRHNQEQRVAHLIKALKLMSRFNSEISFANQVQKEDELYKLHKKYHPLSEKYPKFDAEKKLQEIDRLDQFVANDFADACFYCVKPKEDCFIPTLPDDPLYRFRLGLKPWFGDIKERKKFVKELKNDPDKVCFPYHKVKLDN